MSIPKPLTGSPATLNNTELEILRLLASGHTTKSIAASLGRSETAINERLRVARRKTGASSSRELARLLDAQKIWDENIDLSRRDGSADSPARPRNPGFEWTKGQIAMLILLPAAALGLAVAANTATQHQPATTQSHAAMSAATSPLVGRWALDVARIPADERPQGVKIAFALKGGEEWTTRVEITDADGTVRHADSTAKVDGVPVPVSGTMAFIDTVSLRHPAADTLVMTLSKNGAPVSTRVYTVAKDGKSMTETIIWANGEMPEPKTTTFTRIG
jgi:DNA-binding CsgD family transcriptional regulator